MEQDPKIPDLPNEVYASIIATLTSEQDLVFLWTSMRNVSHFMRDLVDEFVRRRHLTETHLVPQLTAAYTIPQELISQFSHISADNPDLAVFNMMPKMPAVDRQATMRALAAEKRDWARPKVLVAIRRLANDTELPSCQLDEKSCELSVNWRGMFGALLWEEKLRMCLSAKWVERAKAKKAAAIAAADPSRSASSTVFKMAFELRGARDESAGTARYKRIERQMRREHPNFVFTPTRGDIEAFEILELLQQNTNSWDFDD